MKMFLSTCTITTNIRGELGVGESWTMAITHSNRSSEGDTPVHPVFPSASLRTLGKRYLGLWRAIFRRGTLRAVKMR
jgi:hypothetical protein